MKNILFLTATRADFGKLKPLITAVAECEDMHYQIFATGMHLLSQYGLTVNEIYKSGFAPVFTYMNQVKGEEMEIILANTITGLSRYLHEHHVDLIVVHGDRVEALAGATVGALKNVLVAHVEGGEVSGTVDELIRHAVSKLAHVHFVASQTARRRLIQLGEDPDSILVIGSPDLDVMFSDTLPSLERVRERYDIPLAHYAVAILHPVTTEPEQQRRHAETFVDALIESGWPLVVIYPNNDRGSDEIMAALARLEGRKTVRIYPSLRFEYFLALLKNAAFIIGNSSAGIHEAPAYGVPTINIGTRQHRRLEGDSIFNVPFETSCIVGGIKRALREGPFTPSIHYGSGKSAELFIEAFKGDLWDTSAQKYFKDLEFGDDQGA